MPIKLGVVYMTVENLVEKFSFKVLTGKSLLSKKEVKGCYVGDILSWVIEKAQPKNAWVTVAGSVDSIGVAAMAEVSCIILTDGSWLDEKAKLIAEENEMVVLLTKLNSFEVAVKLNEIFKMK